MRKIPKIAMVAMTAVIISLSSVGSVNVVENNFSAKTDTALEHTQEESLSKTVNVVCILSDPEQGYERVIQEMPKEEYYKISAAIMEHKESFKILMSPISTDNEIDCAFKELDPLFQSLRTHELTDKNTSQIESLYERMRETVQIQEKEKEPLGLWNGGYTPLYGNLACMVISLAGNALGFVLGTHSIIPTVGGDLGVIWRNSHIMGYNPIYPPGGLIMSETYSEGVLGYTYQLGGHLGFCAGFAGLLMGIMPPGFIFTGLLRSLILAGVSPLYIGCGIIPG